MWTLFRVENEHCTNVGRFRASRDVPLPYDIPSPELEGRREEADSQRDKKVPGVADHEAQGSEHDNMRHPNGSPESRPAARPHHASTFTSSDALEQQLQQPRTHRAASFSQTRPSPLLNRVGTMLRDAHAQDFERKKKPELGRHPSQRFDREDEEEDTDDDDDDDEGDETVEEGSGEDGDADDERRSIKSGDGQDDPRNWELGENTRDLEEVRREVSIGRGQDDDGVRSP